MLCIIAAFLYSDSIVYIYLSDCLLIKLRISDHKSMIPFCCVSCSFSQVQLYRPKVKTPQKIREEDKFSFW